MESKRKPRAPLSRPCLRHPSTPSSRARMSASVMTCRPLPPHEHSPLICVIDRGMYAWSVTSSEWNGVRHGTFRKKPKYPSLFGYGPWCPKRRGCARGVGATARFRCVGTPARSFGRNECLGRTRRDPGRPGWIARACVSRTARGSPRVAFQIRAICRSGREKIAPSRRRAAGSPPLRR